MGTGHTPLKSKPAVQAGTSPNGYTFTISGYIQASITNREAKCIGTAKVEVT